MLQQTQMLMCMIHESHQKHDLAAYISINVQLCLGVALSVVCHQVIHITTLLQLYDIACCDMSCHASSQ